MLGAVIEGGNGAVGEGTEDNESLERGKTSREQGLDTAIGPGMLMRPKTI